MLDVSMLERLRGALPAVGTELTGRAGTVARDGVVGRKAPFLQHRHKRTHYLAEPCSAVPVDNNREKSAPGPIVRYIRHRLTVDLRRPVAIP